MFLADRTDRRRGPFRFEHWGSRGREVVIGGGGGGGYGLHGSAFKKVAMSVLLGLEGSEEGSIIGYSGSPSTCTSKSTSNRKSFDSDEYEQALLRSMSSS